MIDIWVSLAPTENSDTIVQRILDRYAHVSGSELQYARDAHQRPVVRGCNDLRISVSHTKGALLVALGARCRLGIDIELVGDRGLRNLWHHALTGAELDDLERHECVRRNEVFLGYWTRKEALLKAAGVGLAVEPRLIELPPSRSSPHPISVPETLGRAGDWSIVELDLSGYAAAVAVEMPEPQVPFSLIPDVET